MRLLDRDGELEALAVVLMAARTGNGGAVLVEGPPGIGKSSLLGAARANAAEFRVVAARATELERELPFGVVRQLLEPVLASGTDAERRAALAGSGALAERVLGRPPDGERERPDAAMALHGLYWFTANLAAERPLLVLVDDLQWADAPSLRWLVHLVPRLEDVPIALVLATQPMQEGAAPELVDRLAADRAVRVLHPQELSAAAVAQMTASALAETPGAEFLRACRRATAGNPFLMRELLAELVRRGIATRDTHSARVERLSSREVGRSIRARLHGLPAGCLELARAVAVLGDDVEGVLAARVAGLAADAIAGLADRLAVAAILQPGPALAFVHPLVRESVYAELGASERTRWHGRAADALADAGAGADRIASHLLVAEPCGDPGTVRTLRQAAASACSRGAPEAARTHLRRALLEPPAPEMEPWVVRELGSAELRAGAIAAAKERLADAARRLPDARSRALATAELSTALMFMGDAEQAVAALTDAIDALPEGDRELGLQLEAARFSAAYSTLPAWRQLAVAPRRFEVDAPEPRTVGEEMRIAERAFEVGLRGTAAEAAALARSALAGGRLLASGSTLANAYMFAPAALVFADELEEATQALGDVLACARRRGAVPVLSAASHIRALTWWRRGALDEVEADARQALDDVSYHATPQGALALVNALLARGDTAAAAQAWSDAGLDVEREQGFSAITRLHTRARLAWALGRPQSALDDLFACGRLHHVWDIRTPAVANWRVDAVPLLAALGRTAEARVLAVDELAAARAFGSARTLGAALRAAATVEEGERAIALLRDAVAVLERSPARLEHALAACDLGAALRRAGRRAEARPQLRTAIEVAMQCGAHALTTRAHEELIAAGARPRRDPIESRSKLTASELRVARMAADGMTNREIAQALFVTEKTVENHLGACYRKLEIRSRSQLARALPLAA